jgi:RecJ-like exonuclease
VEEGLVKKVKVGLGIGLVSIGISGCSGLTTVRRVQDHPHRHWFNETVQLQGTVIDRAPLLDAVVYQLQDGTGEIWVLSSEPEIEQGDRVRVRGTVRFERIAIEALELGEAYIEEIERQVEVVDESDAEN